MQGSKGKYFSSFISCPSGTEKTKEPWEADPETWEKGGGAKIECVIKVLCQNLMVGFSIL